MRPGETGPTAHVRPLATDEHLRAFVAPDLDVGGDLLDLLRGDLRTELGVGVQGTDEGIQEYS